MYAPSVRQVMHPQTYASLQKGSMMNLESLQAAMRILDAGATS